MKPIALFAFFFLLFAFTTTTSAEVVLDSDGNAMTNGGKYYLSSIPPYGAPDIEAAAILPGTSDSCSLAVVRVLYGKPWATVISTPYRIAIILTGLPLNISFADLPPNKCTDSPKWVVIRYPHIGDLPVMVGSAQEFGASFVNGWFSIETYDSAKHYYKLVFRELQKESRDIGEHIDGENRRRLVVTQENSLVFQFVKVKENFTSDLSMVV